MWAIARYISKDRIHSNDTVVKVATDAETVETHVFSKLENKPLLELANSIHKAGLGSLEDTLLCIIPPLSCEDKLPVDTVVDFVRQQTRSQELSGNWGSVIARHGELVKFCSKFGIRHLLSFRAAAALVDLCRVVSETLKLWEDQRRRGEEVETLKHLKQNLRNDVSSLDEECVSHLVEMMKMRFEICDDLKSLCTGSEARSSRAHKFFGHSEFLKVFEDDLCSPRTPINTQAAPASPLRASQEDDLKWFRESGGEIEEQGVNTVDIFKWTPLHYVGLTGNDILMKKLLRLKADVKARDIAEYTPLHYASIGGHKSAVKQLLNEGADVDAQGRDGMSSIHLAAKLGHFKIVRLLLLRSARVGIHDNARRTPLHWAAYNSQHEVVDLLLQNNASTDARDDYERTPLLLATLGWKNNKTVQKLLDYHADKNTVDRDKRTAFHLAAEKNLVDLVEFLFDGRIGGKPDMEVLDIDGRTPLHLLAIAGHERVGKVFLDQGANILIEDNDGMTAIHLAAANGHDLLLDSFLIGSCPGLGNMRFEALQLAVNNGHINVVKLLLNQSFDVKHSLSMGKLLHKAAERGHEGVVRCLLEFGAVIYEIDDKRRTPLDVAVKSGKQSIVKILVDKVRDLLPDDRPRTILMAILQQQRFDIINLLLRAKPKVVDDGTNQSLLRRAMQLEGKLMIEFLIDVIVLYGPTLSETARISIEELAWAQHELPSFSMIDRDLAFQMQSTVTTFELFQILWRKFRSKKPEIPALALCSRVLDYGEFWLQTIAENSKEINIDQDDPDEPYVVARVVACSPSPVRKIRFIMRSHDQGTFLSGPKQTKWYLADYD